MLVQSGGVRHFELPAFAWGNQQTRASSQAADVFLRLQHQAGGTTALLNQISGLDDLELLCFLLAKESCTMLSFPTSTVFERLIPKPNSYQNQDVTAEVKRLFIEQIKLMT